MAQKITDRMLLAMHDAFEAAHGNHKQIDEAARRWFAHIGRQEAVREFRAKEVEEAPKP